MLMLMLMLMCISLTIGVPIWWDISLAIGLASALLLLPPLFRTRLARVRELRAQRIRLGSLCFEGAIDQAAVGGRFKRGADGGPGRGEGHGVVPQNRRQFGGVV